MLPCAGLLCVQHKLWRHFRQRMTIACNARSARQKSWHRGKDVVLLVWVVMLGGAHAKCAFFASLHEIELLWCASTYLERIAYMLVRSVHIVSVECRRGGWAHLFAEKLVLLPILQYHYLKIGYLHMHYKRSKNTQTCILLSRWAIARRKSAQSTHFVHYSPSYLCQRQVLRSKCALLR